MQETASQEVPSSDRTLALLMHLSGIFLCWLLGFLNLVLCIIAAVKANDGKDYRYPMSIGFVS